MKYSIIDGNEAAAYIAYRFSEVIAIYPITPSSTMGELADYWNSLGKKNAVGTLPEVVEMQSEGGAAGAIHGAIQAGALTSTFTASQGLLLMLPNMFKIAGELTPTVFHVAARSIATHALSIFGDHSDVMAARQTGFAMLCSNSVQESMDLALIAHIATLKSRIPFMHFFDGFRTSHEVSKIEMISDETIKKLLPLDEILEHRKGALTPDSPTISGTAQNPDVFFQAREGINKYYDNTPDIVESVMSDFKSLTGREYLPFQYFGDPKATKVIIMMGSGAGAAQEYIDFQNSKGEKVGLLKVRLYRPFSAKHFFNALPRSVKKIAVLDRTKEAGSTGEPLYLDVMTTMLEAFQSSQLPFDSLPQIIGGRYGLSSKEFTPSMVKTIFEELDKSSPKNHFTIGINDDVTFTSLEYDKTFNIENDETFKGIFWGLGADGTVSANKNSIKIIGETTDNYAQGYFVYDSKKSGSKTTSYLRFGKKEIHSTYLIDKADFIACHQFQFLNNFEILEKAKEGATFLINAPYEKDDVWSNLPAKVQKEICEKKIRLYSIDAVSVAKKTGMGVRINTIMQTCFFAISGILPSEEAIAKIKASIEKSFGKKGEEIVQKNFRAVDETVANLFEINYESLAHNNNEKDISEEENIPEFVKNVTLEILKDRGENLPVSAFQCGGVFPTGTTQYEKRNIATEIPVWDPETCIQCGKCSNICPHGVIRIKAYDEKHLAQAPSTFKSIKAKGKEFEASDMYTIQVAPEDCTGCELCVEICPAKNKSVSGLKAINMATQLPIVDEEKKNWSFFQKLPNFDRSKLNLNQVKNSQLLEPLFEFSGACSGCGETPYIKLITQLYGDRMMIANATGCSSIYGGNLPSTPYTKNSEGRGPAWSNSLFEDNAEYGLGFRLAVDKKKVQAEELIVKHSGIFGKELVQSILENPQSNEVEIEDQRNYVLEIKKLIDQNLEKEDMKNLLSLSDYLVSKSVWIFGGDGWAYDIGFGGLDHVLASGKNVNVLVMDTEVYSNTGGQMSKATPMGAVAKFAANGKPLGKKDLGLFAMGYGHVYVAKIAMGANDTQTLKAIMEAERYPGPSLIIAYSHCIAHGYNLKYGVEQQKLAVNSGHWNLFRYNPLLENENKNPFVLESKAPKVALQSFMDNEARFKVLQKISPQRAKDLAQEAQQQAVSRHQQYERLSSSYEDKGEK